MIRASHNENLRAVDTRFPSFPPMTMLISYTVCVCILRASPLYVTMPCPFAHMQPTTLERPAGYVEARKKQSRNDNDDGMA